MSISKSVNKKKYNRGQDFRKKKENKQSISENEELASLHEQRLKIGLLENSKITQFDQFPLSNHTKRGLIDGDFITPTKVQSHSLIYSLQSLDVVVAAKTGSGKTLAFLIPVLESLYCKKWTGVDGIGAIIITPTRELAYQIFEVLKKIGKYHCFSAGLVIGGKDLKFEWRRVNRCNIIICTPGRLLQHMIENSDFSYENVQVLVLDEADQCLSLGFADTMNIILTQLPSERQTLLFSATQTRDVQDLIRAGCKNPLFCSVHEFSQSVTPKTLNEHYVICEDHEKITFLWSFFKNHKDFKILVFLATCHQVKFFMNLFKRLKPGLSVMGLCGDMHQLRRMDIYDSFKNNPRPAVLFATDVAARGLDIPSVQWVIQLDCPEDVTTYIHRAGRTARHTKVGNSLLVISSAQEEPMLMNLKTKAISVMRQEVMANKLQNIQIKVESSVIKYSDLKDQAMRAFKSYLKSMYLMRDKKVFDVKAVDLDAYARSLGLAVTPRVRYIQRRMKNSNTSKSVSNTEIENDKEPLKTFDLGSDDDDDSDDDLLVSSKKKTDMLTDTVEGELGRISVSEPLSLQTIPTPSHKKVKVITKYAIAKKLQKKLASVNSKIKFDEDGEVILDPRYDKGQNSTSVMSEEGGLDIRKMKDALWEEDKIDKKRHYEQLKEKKRNQKEKEKAEKEKGKTIIAESECLDYSSSEEDDFDTQDIIDELPDPDKLYTNKRLLDDSEASSEDESSTNDSLDNSNKKLNSNEKHIFRGKIQAKKQAKEQKRRKLVESNTFESIPFREKEDLALFLLKQGR